MWSLKEKIQMIIQRDFLKIKKLLKSHKVLTPETEISQAILDIAEVINDSSYVQINHVTKNMADEFIRNPERYKAQRDFILNSLTDSQSNKEIAREIDEIKKEINESQINEITEGWVKESLEMKQEGEYRNLKAKDNREYILESLVSGNNQDGIEIQYIKNIRRSFIIKIIGLSAAALIAIALIIRTLVPTENLVKTYTKYYKPFDAIPPISRNIIGDLDTLFKHGIELYNQGKYQTAAIVFSVVIKKDTSNYAPRFFAGITQMELANYGQANTLLSEVMVHSIEFRKEAQWYLGLSYLKTGEKGKAISCLIPIAESDGFYRDRARKILRSLK